MLKVSSGELINRHADREKLERFISEVESANKAFNLYSRSLGKQGLLTLVGESLLPVELGWIDDAAGPIADLGSGWGIPAVPILLWNSGLDITLIERSKKKADFLSLLMNRLSLSATVINSDLANLTPERKYRLITLRQIAMDEKFLKAMAELADDSSRIIYFGPKLPDQFFSDVITESYIIDNLPERRLVSAKIV
jgi:16S rRNA G527 N7-methylase RsmG